MSCPSFKKFFFFFFWGGVGGGGAAGASAAFLAPLRALKRMGGETSACLLCDA